MKSNHTARRILVVDDNDEAAELLQILLNLDGYEAIVALSGTEGLKAAASFQPHVICSDIGMPGMSGIEFAKEVRKSQHSNKAFLIAVSGWNDIDTANATKSAGFDLHLGKPVSYEEISTYIRKFFEHSHV